MRRVWGTLAIAFFALVSCGKETPAPTPTAPANVPAASAPTDDSIRVALLNLRLPMGKDEENNAWPKRADRAVTAMRKTSPDIIGLQEVFSTQRLDLIDKMPEYAVYPDRREEGVTLGNLVNVNFTLIMYRKDRFDVIDSANGTVRDGAVKDPNATAFYSMVILRDRYKKLPDTIVVSTHIRHNMTIATQECDILNNRVTAQLRLHKGAVAIVMGDLNFDKSTPVYGALMGKTTATTRSAVTTLVDTYDYAAKPAKDRWGSYHAFTGNPSALWPTDFIFISENLSHSVVQVDREQISGGYPSDHFPVSVTLRPVAPVATAPSN